MSVYGATRKERVTEKEVRAPLSCYGVGKLAAENYLEVYKAELPFVSMRMFNVYGERQNMDNLMQGMVSIYVAQALADRHIQVRGSLDRFRDFIFVNDAVEAWVRALSFDACINQHINIGTGKKTFVWQLLSEIQELVPNVTIEEKQGTTGDQYGIFADNTKLQTQLEIDNFVPLKKGLAKFIAWAQHK